MSRVRTKEETPWGPTISQERGEEGNQEGLPKGHRLLDQDSLISPPPYARSKRLTVPVAAPQLPGKAV